MVTLGVHSETGRLREVIVHRPDLSLRRLTPDNCKALLFDDVLWVKRARQEHDIFVDALRERGVTVHLFGELLAETVAISEARDWLLDRRVHASVVGHDLVDELRRWLDAMSPDQLSSLLVGGIARAELPFEPAGLTGKTLLTQVKVHPTDAAFGNPTKPIGPGYDEAAARRLATERGWQIARDNDKWRRVVASPKPLEILEAQVLAFLIERWVIVICAGGSGIPVIELRGGSIAGVEAIVDKGHASSLLARQLRADMLLMLTDVDVVYLGWGTPSARALAEVAISDLSASDFAAGSMRPKVDAAIEFARSTGKPAAIGRLEDAAAILAGTRGNTDHSVTQPIARPFLCRRVVRSFHS